MPVDGVKCYTLDLKVFFFFSQLLLAPTSDEMPNVVKEQRVPKKNQHQNDTKFIHNRPNKHPASCSVISIHLHTTLLCPQMIRLCVFSLGSCGWVRVICNFVHTSLNAVADYLNSIFFFLHLAEYSLSTSGLGHSSAFSLWLFTYSHGCLLKSAHLSHLLPES